MNNYDLINDMQVLTQIPLNTINKLVDIAIKDVAQIILTSSKEENGISAIDIGIGDLKYQFVDDNIVFSFEPTEYLVDLISNKKTTILEDSISEKLKNKVLSTYKELM